jgi:hypothetical protein
MLLAMTQRVSSEEATRCAVTVQDGRFKTEGKPFARRSLVQRNGE